MSSVLLAYNDVPFQQCAYIAGFFNLVPNKSLKWVLLRFGERSVCVGMVFGDVRRGEGFD